MGTSVGPYTGPSTAKEIALNSTTTLTIPGNSVTEPTRAEIGMALAETGQKGLQIVENVHNTLAPKVSNALQAGYETTKSVTSNLLDKGTALVNYVSDTVQNTLTAVKDKFVTSNDAQLPIASSPHQAKVITLPGIAKNQEKITPSTVRITEMNRKIIEHENGQVDVVITTFYKGADGIKTFELKKTFADGTVKTIERKTNQAPDGTIMESGKNEFHDYNIGKGRMNSFENKTDNFGNKAHLREYNSYDKTTGNNADGYVLEIRNAKGKLVARKKRKESEYLSGESLTSQAIAA